jgi:hypothetical protein
MDTNYIPLPSVDYSCGFWCWFKFVVIPVLVCAIILFVLTIIIKIYNGKNNNNNRQGNL